MTYKLYWGDLHSHCSISYGHGTVELALKRAREQLDFCSVTGHAFWPDMPTDRDQYGEIIDYHRQGFATLAGNWEELLRLQAEGSRPGQFIAFPSYEWHSLEYGDHNVYSAGPELPLLDAPNLSGLRSSVAPSGAIAIPHHIGYRVGYRGINWDAFREDVSPFVEIFSLHGCSLSDDAPYPMLHDMGPRDADSTAHAGWERGYRFGVVGGTDHHAAYPGSHGDGRMGVFAAACTRESLWEAFCARRVYAATGDKIDARLFVDDAWIGESVKSNSKRVVRLTVAARHTIDKVHLLKNGRILRRFFTRPFEPEPDRRHRYRLRLTWGWGRNTVPVAWNGRLTLSHGKLLDVDTCFSGQAIVAPKGTQADQEELGDADLPHRLLERDDKSCCWTSITQGNKTMRHETTQGLSLTVEARLTDEVAVEVNGVQYTYALGDLLRKARSHYLRGWLSEAIQIGPMVPVEDCTLTAEFEDVPDRDVDYYRLEVSQTNSQCVWLTPIWAER